MPDLVQEDDLMHTQKHLVFGYGTPVFELSVISKNLIQSYNYSHGTPYLNQHATHGSTNGCSSCEQSTRRTC